MTSIPAHLPRLSRWSPNYDIIARCCRATIVDVIRWGFHLITGDEKIGDFLQGESLGQRYLSSYPYGSNKDIHSRLNSQTPRRCILGCFAQVDWVFSPVWEQHGFGANANKDSSIRSAHMLIPLIRANLERLVSQETSITKSYCPEMLTV